MGVLKRLVALLLVGCAGCASPGHRLVAEPPGTPSWTGCDADVQTDSLNGVHLRLLNRSASHECRATRLILEFKAGVEPNWIQVSTPSGWRQSYVDCTSGDRVCGIAWHSKPGVAAGDSQDGFGVMCDPRRLKSWTVDVGKRRIALPYGWVGGSVGPAPEEILAPSNKGMKLTKLSAAPLQVRRCRLMPAPSGLDAGTASQLIPGVRWTFRGAREWLAR